MLKHLACIMDGNRRWAKKHGLVAWEGHREGVEAIKRVIKFCINSSISCLSLYTFSLENFQRSHKEKYFLFNILPKEIKNSVLEFLIKHNVRAKFIGDRKLFPGSIKPFINELESNTANNTGLQLNLLFCYGGRQEILQGVKKIAHQIKKGELDESQITEELLEKSMWMGEFPFPDMVIRTSGISRISNFLIYQSAYSELYFSRCLWPEINKEHLNDALQFYQKTQRNFGE